MTFWPTHTAQYQSQGCYYSQLCERRRSTAQRWRLRARQGRVYEDKLPATPLHIDRSKKKKQSKNKSSTVEIPLGDIVRSTGRKEASRELESLLGGSQLPGDFDDDEEEEEWESGTTAPGASVFEEDEGWTVSDMDSPPRMEPMERFEKELRSNKTRKIERPLTGRMQSLMRPELVEIPALAKFSPQALQALEMAQNRADAHNKHVEARTAAKGDDRQTHRRLRIITGTLAGRALVSATSLQTRPMMGKVRGALFDMLLALCGGGPSFPRSTRWLDLYAGTGSVGLEALSRGADEAHFIELDPWVCRSILKRNVQDCQMEAKSSIYSSKTFHSESGMQVELFLQQAQRAPEHYPKAFDFISVCPPYLHVSYPELLDLLAASPFIHSGTRVVIEYPRSLASQMNERLGPLFRIRARKYGRTYIAIYGPATDMSRGVIESVPRG